MNRLLTSPCVHIQTQGQDYKNAEQRDRQSLDVLSRFCQFSKSAKSIPSGQTFPAAKLPRCRCQEVLFPHVPYPEHTRIARPWFFSLSKGSFNRPFPLSINPFAPMRFRKGINPVHCVLPSQQYCRRPSRFAAFNDVTPIPEILDEMGGRLGSRPNTKCMGLDAGYRSAWTRGRSPTEAKRLIYNPLPVRWVDDRGGRGDHGRLRGSEHGPRPKDLMRAVTEGITCNQLCALEAHKRCGPDIYEMLTLDGGSQGLLAATDVCGRARLDSAIRALSTLFRPRGSSVNGRMSKA